MTDDRTKLLQRAELAADGLNKATARFARSRHRGFSSPDDLVEAREDLHRAIKSARRVHEELTKNALTTEPIWSTLLSHAMIVEGTVDEVPAREARG
jgi:hypothetical protein